MEKKEIIIGRQVEKGNYQIDEQYKLVGRRHARLIRKPEGFYIEDLDSANGTFVNSKSVKVKKIVSSDKVMLGGQNYYELNLAKAMKMLPMSDQEFQAAFQNLKKVYDHYQKTKVKIQKESQGMMMIKRSIPMALPGIAMMFLKNFPALQIFGGVLSAVAMVICSIWASKSMAKTPELINNLREQFLMDYVCPNCGQDFGERPWENIKRQGKCKACGREFN